MSTNVQAPTRRYVSIDEAAAYSGTSIRTVRRRIADGTVTGYRFGPRQIRIDLAELDSALRPIPTGAA